MIKRILPFIFLALSLSGNAQTEFPGITIGEQVWMSKNLDVTQFSDGSEILHATSKAAWVEACENMQPAWCYYNFDASLGSKYGKLYNWYAVSEPRHIAPAGWRVPTESDWAQLIETVDYDSGSKKLKSTAGWDGYTDGENTSGFNAKPSGVVNSDGSFEGKGTTAMYWTSSISPSYHNKAVSMMILGEIPGIHSNLNEITMGMAIRCVK